MAILTKNNLKNLAIVILLITNVSTISTIFVHEYRVKHHFKHGHGHPPLPPDSHRHEEHFSRFLVKELDLTSEQEEKIHIYQNEFRQKSRALMEQMNEYRIVINNELKKQNPNKDTLNKGAEAIGKHHEKIKILSFEMLINMKKVCNDEQQKKLVEIFVEMQPKHKDRRRKKRH